MIKIFLLLIISFQITKQLDTQNIQDTQLEDVNLNLKVNDFKKINIQTNQKLHVCFEREKTYYITLLSKKDTVKIDITNKNELDCHDLKNDKTNLVTFQLIINNTNINCSDFSINEDAEIQITCVGKTDITEYEKIEYNVDQEIKVTKNNFIIFLTESDEEHEKFDMKFNFKDDIQGEKVHYGFLYLPTDNLDYIALGKNYEDLDNTDFGESAKEITVNNKYYEKDKDSVKKHFAFIFSIDSEVKKVQEYSFTINSEIINAFLIVSIVIALVFAVITFFLIRRKQSSESTTIEGGGESFYQNKNKDEKEEKEEKEEKDDKEEATEN